LDAVEQYAKIVAMLGELKDPAKQRLGAKVELAKAHFGLGLALWEAGKFPEAIDHYREVLEIKPDFVEVHNNLGLALGGQGHLDEGIAHFRKAVEIKPDYVEAHNNLGLALANRGQVDEAIGHFRTALGLASARNDRALADAIRAQITHLHSAAPAGKTL